MRPPLGGEVGCAATRGGPWALLNTVRWRMWASICDPSEEEDGVENRLHYLLAQLLTAVGGFCAEPERLEAEPAEYPAWDEGERHCKPKSILRWKYSMSTRSTLTHRTCSTS